MEGQACSNPRQEKPGVSCPSHDVQCWRLTQHRKKNLESFHYRGMLYYRTTFIIQPQRVPNTAIPTHEDQIISSPCLWHHYTLSTPSLCQVSTLTFSLELSSVSKRPVACSTVQQPLRQLCNTTTATQSSNEMPSGAHQHHLWGCLIDPFYTQTTLCTLTVVVSPSTYYTL